MFLAFFGVHDTHVRHSILNARSAFYSLLIFLALIVFSVIALILSESSPKPTTGLLHSISLSNQQWSSSPQLEPGITVSTTRQPTLTPTATLVLSNTPLPIATLWGILTITPTITPTAAISDISPIAAVRPTYDITSTIHFSQTPTETITTTLMPTYTNTLSPSVTPTMYPTSTEIFIGATPTPTVVITSTAHLSQMPTVTVTEVITEAVTEALMQTYTNTLSPSTTPTILLTSTEVFTSATPTPTVVPTQTMTFTPTIVATFTATPMPTVTAIHTIMPTPTHTVSPLPTVTLTNSMAATPTSLPIPTSSKTPSYTATIIPPSNAVPDKTNTPTDVPNDMPTATPIPTNLSGVSSTCQQDAMEISSDGIVHSQQFDALDNASWIYFETEENEDYLIEASLYPGVEMIDMKVELYESCDPPSLIDSQSITPSHKIRLTHHATATRRIYLKVINASTDNTQDNLSKGWPYELSVYNIDSLTKSGALVILGSHLDDGDEQQSNVNNLARRVYNMYLDAYSSDNIRFLIDDPGPSLEEVDNIFVPSRDELQKAITTWATERMEGGHRSFTLYMVGHTDIDTDAEHFYIDKPNKELLTPDELNSWLTQLEENVPGVEINVIIESSNSGIFMGSDKSNNKGISKQGRVIITSANANSHAYSTRRGAIFSDFFLREVERGATLLHGYMNGIRVAQQARDWQHPGLDADGDGTPNRPADYTIASKRGRLYSQGYTPLSLSDTPSWNAPPSIVNIDGTKIEDGTCTVKAHVEDDVKVCRVWSIIREPGFAMPVQSASLGVDTNIGVHILELDLCSGVIEVTYRNLVDQGNDRYEGTFSCIRKGRYHISVFAEDNEGEEAVPDKGYFTNPGTDIFLPIVFR